MVPAEGFVSVVYGLLVFELGIPAAEEIFRLVAVTIGLSIVLHSSTDVVVARQFDEAEEVPAWLGAISASSVGTIPRADVRAQVMAAKRSTRSVGPETIRMSRLRIMVSGRA